MGVGVGVGDGLDAAVGVEVAAGDGGVVGAMSALPTAAPQADASRKAGSSQPVSPRSRVRMARTVSAPWSSPEPRRSGLPTYAFVTTFEVGAPPEDVFALVVEPEPWLAHWGDVITVDRRQPPGPDGTGSSIAGSVRAPWGYRIGGRIDVVAADRPERVEMQVTGTIRGSGLWRLQPTRRGTAARFTWTVWPVARWLRVLTLVARPTLEAAHATVVRHAVDAAAAHLDAPVHAFDSRAGRPAVRHR